MCYHFFLIFAQVWGNVRHATSLVRLALVRRSAAVVTQVDTLSMTAYETRIRWTCLRCFGKPAHVFSSGSMEQYDRKPH